MLLSQTLILVLLSSAAKVKDPSGIIHLFCLIVFDN